MLKFFYQTNKQKKNYGKQPNNYYEIRSYWVNDLKKILPTTLTHFAQAKQYS